MPGLAAKACIRPSALAPIPAMRRSRPSCMRSASSSRSLRPRTIAFNPEAVAAIPRLAEKGYGARYSALVVLVAIVAAERTTRRHDGRQWHDLRTDRPMLRE